MKKAQLLTSILSLALVLTLGACSKTEDEENSDESLTREESTSSNTSESESDESVGDTTENPPVEYEGDPVKDLLETVKQENNYSLRIEYQDYRSSSYGDAVEMYADFWAGTITKNFVYDYVIDLTYTKDAFLLEYYLSNEYGVKDAYDIEVYVNTDSGLDVYFVSANYTTNLWKYTTYPSTTWQEYFPNLLDLGEYLEYINVDSDTYDERKVDYIITVDTLDLLTNLVDRLYKCGNYYPDSNNTKSSAPFVVNYKTYWETSGAPYIDSTYLYDTQEWDTTMYYIEDIGTGSDHQLYYFSASSYVYDVGNSSIDSVYTSQFNS